MPVVAVWTGWHTVFDEKTFAVWVLDFIFAFVLGIGFQYFAIVPMRKLAPARGRRRGAEGRHAVARRLADRHVRPHGLRAVLRFQARVRDACRSEHAGVLVHDADRDARRLRHGLSGQLVAHPAGIKEKM